MGRFDTDFTLGKIVRFFQRYIIRWWYKLKGNINHTFTNQKTHIMRMIFPKCIKLNNLVLFKTFIEEKISKFHNAALILISCQVTSCDLKNVAS